MATQKTEDAAPKSAAKKTHKSEKTTGATKTLDAPDFESSLAELENLVEKLEQGDLSLESSLETFEKGVKLTRHCQSALQDAEQKVKVLMSAGEKEDGDQEINLRDLTSPQE